MSTWSCPGARPHDIWPENSQIKAQLQWYVIATLLLGDITEQITLRTYNMQSDKVSSLLYLIEDPSSILGTHQVNSITWNCVLLLIQLDTVASL